MKARPDQIVFACTVSGPGPTRAAVYVASKTGLPEEKVWEAMVKGALWHRRNRPAGGSVADARDGAGATGRGPLLRLYAAQAVVNPGDWLELHYDPFILGAIPPEAVLIHDATAYSVWDKPPGLLAQGTQWGDHGSLLRQAELFFAPRRPAYLVHRLDRETRGIMVVAHEKKAAGAFGRLFADGGIDKEYEAEVAGNLFMAAGPAGVIDQALDGKRAVTRYEALSYDPVLNRTRLKVEIETGRLHQIRRHLAAIGFPVVGDPRYGRGNKNRDGLQLAAVKLAFICPVTGRAITFQAPER